MFSLSHFLLLIKLEIRFNSSNGFTSIHLSINVILKLNKNFILKVVNNKTRLFSYTALSAMDFATLGGFCY